MRIHSIMKMMCTVLKGFKIMLRYVFWTGRLQPPVNNWTRSLGTDSSTDGNTSTETSGQLGWCRLWRGDMWIGWIALITSIYLLEENDLTCICILYLYTYYIYNIEPKLRLFIQYAWTHVWQHLPTTSGFCLRKGIWTSKFQPGTLKVSRKPWIQSKCQVRIRVFEVSQGNQPFPEQVPRKSGLFPWYSPPQQIRRCTYIHMYRWEQCAWFSHDSCIRLLLLDVFEAVCEIWVVCPSHVSK